MTGIEYFFSFAPARDVFLPLGLCANNKSALREAEEILNRKTRKFSIPLWVDEGEAILVGKRIMPERVKNEVNTEDASPGRIKFLVAPLSITRSKKGKIKLAVKEKEFRPHNKRADDYSATGTPSA